LLTGERASYLEIANTPFSTHLKTFEPLDIPVEQFLLSMALMKTPCILYALKIEGLDDLGLEF